MVQNRKSKTVKSKDRRVAIHEECGEAVVQRGGGIVTPPMRCFVQQLATGLTPYQAYTIAYPESAAEERKAVYYRANHLVKNAWVDAQLKNMDFHGMQKARVDRDAIISELDAISNSDMHDIMYDTEEGFKAMRRFDEMRPSSRRCIKKVKQKVHYDKESGVITQIETEVELYDKLTAASTLAKIAGMYNETQNKYAGVNISFIGLPLPDYNTKDTTGVIDVTPVDDKADELRAEEKQFYDEQVDNESESEDPGEPEDGEDVARDSVPSS